MTVRLIVLMLGLLVAGGAQAECSKRACDLDRNGRGSRPGDYSVMLAALGTSEGEAGFDKRADLDGDGAVTSTDFKILQLFCPLGQ